MQINRRSVLGTLGLGLALAASRTLCGYESQSALTTVTIDGDMCNGCIKKLKTALAGVAGIGSIEGDSKTRTLTITPSANSEVSPRAVWEAIEKTGKKIVKIVGPRGTFTAKPNA
jgi:copper chaperone CopZ